ncbi:MAG: methyl-accepting chemotaxis protein [Syntrophobacteraceae bacterium]
MLNRFKLSTKMMIVGAGGVACFTVVLAWVYLRIEERIYRDKQAMLMNVVEVPFSLLAEYEARVKAGELTPEEGRKQAALRVKSLRYGGQEYFWINDLEPKMVMHPFKPELDGKSLADNADPTGKRLFMEMVNACKASGGGFVHYMWPRGNDKTPIPKISYVKLFEPWGWVIGSGVYVDDILKELNEVRTVFLGVVLVLTVGGLMFSWIIARSTALPIGRAIDGLGHSAREIGKASSRMFSASQGLAEGASEQAAAIEETSSSLEELSSMTRLTAENAGQADQLMQETNRIVKSANESMQQVTTSMEEISQASEETQKIVKTIDEIAFQTNLLALNAAVEAARAGEAGAGFAVVADEVRNLAMRAAESARNTAGLIESTVKKINAGVGLVGKTNQEFVEVESMVTRSGGLIREIAAASKEQAQGLENLNHAVQQLDRVVQQNVASADESASLSQEMRSQTSQMGGLTADLARLIGSKGHRDAVVRDLSGEVRRPAVKPVRRMETQSFTVMGKAAPRIPAPAPLPKSGIARTGGSRRTDKDEDGDEF